jgi:competence protein ComEC
VDESWGILVGSAIVLGALAGPVAALILGWLLLVAQLIRQRIWWAPFGVILAGVLLGAGRAQMVTEDAVPAELQHSEGALGTVLTMPEPSGDYLAFQLRVDDLITGDGQIDVQTFTVSVTLATGTTVFKGDRVSIAWSADDLAAISPGYEEYLSAKGVSATAWASSVEVVDQGPWLFRMVQGVRDDIGDGLSRLMPGDAGALATGIVTGDDSDLSEEARQAFLRTGTSHITAVSGSNVAMVLAVWNLVIPAGRRRKLLAVQIVIVTSIWLYALLTGLEPPATRAATMASLMLFGSRFGRRPDPMTLLALTSAAMVIWNPRNVEMISFWLSIVASMAIIMRVPTEAETGWGRVARGMFEGLSGRGR